MKIVLLYAHILSLAAAIGAMIMTELLISRRFRNFSYDLFEVIQLAHRTINWSLAVLWLSGIGFLLQGYSEDPAYIMNQKVWVKVLVVALVTLNGYFISRRVLPNIRGLCEGNLLAKSVEQALLFRVSISISLAGWLIAVFFGLAKFLSYQANFFELLGGYLGLTAIFFCGSFCLPNSPLTHVSAKSDEGELLKN
ncbi:hypothetical protein K6Y31_17260 [Motilimonas cestriensis]|uniref:DUF2214 family protein n=1 Tax=Motilimonas cestriensis TaxID=2742685 RepID=A0ABS8WFV4_9GAMM|nr:hypothetical protein [Motilimonas cestriensis]MCE2596546.1 hypothetical protein [Motilimonas cestriensis]